MSMSGKSRRDFYPLPPSFSSPDRAIELVRDVFDSDICLHLREWTAAKRKANAANRMPRRGQERPKVSRLYTRVLF